MNELPPLPEPIAWFADYGGDVFKADQMRAYARAAIEAHEARKVPDGVVVSRDFIRGFRTLVHNYSLRAEAPGHYWGVEADAFSAAYARCGRDLAEVDKLLASAPPAPQAEQNSVAYKEAANLATALFKKHFAHEEHYASGQIVWELCDTTAGVISQIDNMVSGLVQPLPAPQASLTAPVREPLTYVDRRNIILSAVNIGHAIDLTEAAHGITKDTPSQSVL